MLDFLKTATIADVAEVKTGHIGGPRKQRNPEGLAIRVFRDGSVYPSMALVEQFSLEYSEKLSDDQEITGNGFDVIDTDHYPSFQIGKRILIISAVAKSAAKVDLFASTTYDEKGAPKSTVLNQGSKTYGSEELIPMIEEIYGIKFKEKAGDEEPGVEYVDMLLVGNPSTNQPWSLPNGKTVTFIPKKVSRGEAKGTYTVTRRENPAFFAFLPAVMVNDDAKETTVEDVAEAPTELQSNAISKGVPTVEDDAEVPSAIGVEENDNMDAMEENPFGEA
jgi:hypothetical protein